MAFLFCKPWLHGFCTVFARSVFSMSDDVGRCIALQSVPFFASGEQCQAELCLHFRVGILEQFQKSRHGDGGFACGGYSLWAGGVGLGIEAAFKLLAQLHTGGLLDMGVGVHQHICRCVSSSSLHRLHIAAGDHQLIAAFGRVFLVDSCSTLVGSIFGISTVSCFAESASGIESGSRTGLSNVATSFLFLLCCFVSPLFLMIPGAATGAALVVVGISMLETVKDLDFEPIEFLPVAAMWLTTVYMSDYVGGIVIGMFVYMFINIFRALFERDKKYIPSLPVWVMTALMSLYYIF